MLLERAMSENQVALDIDLVHESQKFVSQQVRLLRLAMPVHLLRLNRRISSNQLKFRDQEILRSAFIDTSLSTRPVVAVTAPAVP
eukprot:SAG11_NODE_29970_length_305_cov_1.000000_1_plen_84_part_10